MFSAGLLPPLQYRFATKSSPDKFRGLQNYGPAIMPPTERPTFGFVFPAECRHDANFLFRALKNGTGYFRGLERAFHIPLTTDQVFAITGFTLEDNPSDRNAARRYVDAIVNWQSKSEHRPDLFFVIHPRTSDLLDQTPYYECKAELLNQGILSQHVTTDLLRTENQFKWSVANIALQAFAKIGGSPWLLDNPNFSEDLVIGIGHTHLQDPTTRETTRFIGFTSCFTTSGQFQFMTLGRTAENETDFLQELTSLVKRSLHKASQLGERPNTITLHVPASFRKQHYKAVNSVISRSPDVPDGTLLRIIRVNDNPHIFAVNLKDDFGLPNRGTFIKVGDNDYLLYTEGKEERLAWRQRTPTCLRVKPEFPRLSDQEIQEVVAQIYGISQVNWRGFNASSQPITTHYSKLIARILAHVPASSLSNIYRAEISDILQYRMWFL